MVKLENEMELAAIAVVPSVPMFVSHKDFKDFEGTLTKLKTVKFDTSNKDPENPFWKQRVVDGKIEEGMVFAKVDVGTEVLDVPMIWLSAFKAMLEKANTTFEQLETANVRMVKKGQNYSLNVGGGLITATKDGVMFEDLTPKQAKALKGEDKSNYDKYIATV